MNDLIISTGVTEFDWVLWHITMIVLPMVSCLILFFVPFCFYIYGRKTKKRFIDIWLNDIGVYRDYIVMLILLQFFSFFLSYTHFSGSTVHEIKIYEKQISVILRNHKIENFNKDDIKLISYDQMFPRSSWSNKFERILVIYSKDGKRVYDLPFMTNDTKDYLIRLCEEFNGRK